MPKLRQRYKIYKAEWATWPWYGSPTPEAAQGWYDWVARTKWCRDHSPIRHFRVVYPVFGKLSGVEIDGDTCIIDFGPFSLTWPNMVHELGHPLDYHEGKDRDAMERDHNDVFAGIYLALVKRYISADDAILLQNEFVKRDVKWIPYI